MKWCACLDRIWELRSAYFISKQGECCTFRQKVFGTPNYNFVAPNSQRYVSLVSSKNVQHVPFGNFQDNLMSLILCPMQGEMQPVFQEDFCGAVWLMTVSETKGKS